MNVIHLKATVTEERRLIIDLPPDTPLGEVTVTVTPQSERDILREKLRAAGLLVEFDMPTDYVPLSNEELGELGRLPEGAKSTEELVDEDRGPI